MCEAMKRILEAENFDPSPFCSCYKNKNGKFTALAMSESIGEFETMLQALQAANKWLKEKEGQIAYSEKVSLDCRLRRFVRLADERAARLFSVMAHATAKDLYTDHYKQTMTRYHKAVKWADYCQNKRYELREL